jgi:solute carrier family 25 oxoglutarate transporter 11
MPERPLWWNFLAGGVGGCLSTSFVHPFDVIRVQMQIDKGTPSFVATVKNIVKDKGVTGLYRGLSAGYVRQLTYGLTKFGVYSTITGAYEKKGKKMSFVEKLGGGCFSGACAALVGNPAEVALVRMTADSKLPLDQRRNYTNVFNAMGRVVSEEGPATLWRGIGPHINRAAALSAAQLATMAQAKEMLKEYAGMKDGIGLVFVASLFSGLACTVASCPMDVLKTRIQNMKSVDGVPEYSGALDCATKIIKGEGPTALFKGFGAFYVKLAPYTTLVFIFMGQLHGEFDRRNNN